MAVIPGEPMTFKRGMYIAASVLLIASFAVTTRYIAEGTAKDRPTADRSFPWRHVDLLPIWAGSRMILRRESPYSDSATRAIQVEYYGRALRPGEKDDPVAFVYPACTALFASPLALLPWPAASTIAFFGMLFGTLVSVPIWLRVLDIRVSRAKVWLYAGAVIASWPALAGLRLENISLLIIPVIAVATWCLVRGYPVSAGFLFAACTVKPQLVCLLLPWLALRSALRREWRFLSSFGATLAASFCVTTLLVPHWVGAWYRSLTYYVTYQSVTPGLLFRFDEALAGIALLILWHFRRVDLGRGVSLALAATYAAAPLGLRHGYDMLCLVPACLYLLEHRVTGRVAWFRVIAIELLALGFLLEPMRFALHRVYPHGTIVDWLAGGDIFLLPIAVAVALSAILMSSSRSPERVTSQRSVLPTDA